MAKKAKLTKEGARKSSTMTSRRKNKATTLPTRKSARAASEFPIIVAPKFIKGERWISWKQGGAEYLLKASTIGRIWENSGRSEIVVSGAGGDLRIDTTMEMFVFAMEAE